ncbi:MAG: anti-sigma F factor [Clostridia bacterium]|nr:anti-sigma F factor [Clostridia bacterium]
MKSIQKGQCNHMRVVLPAISVNEAVARAAVAAFCAQCSPTATDLADLKCAVSEAVTNCIVHAYRGCEGNIWITARVIEGGVRVAVRDRGCGIADVKKAREPLFTTDRQNERSGMGFTVMESFTDRLTVHSVKGRGTLVVMTKYMQNKKQED